ncbi:hypothetical protein BH10BAC5_BH10BAC5_04190 [soil metagenome]
MQEKITDKNNFMFYSLIQDFHMRGMVYLGKLKNPMTDKIEKNLEAVQIIIDMLDMLKEKTVNNLKDDEKRYLDQALMDLRLNYVDEAAKDKEGTETSSIESKTESDVTENNSSENSDSTTEDKSKVTTENTSGNENSK